ncbi:MAG: alcohol dehydrogenase catalytic domain-containing protein, partial [Halobacteriales archaeon]|nr:alcohol dehydrogenase catalytic domain-containing protein [Halobacteriales archaeon]
MKAIVQTGPEAVEVQERDRPEIAPGEALVKVHSAGLCGSDAHAYKYEGGYEWIPFPRIMGHEYAGEVVEVGADVGTLTVGETVVEHPVHTCGNCFQCLNGQANVCQEFSITGMHRDGAWADYVAVDAQYLHRVPDGVSPADAAITEPTSIATRAVIERSDAAPGDTVLVEGPGPIGVLTAAVANAQGANVLVSGLERDAAHRLPLVEDLGIETVDASEENLDAVADTFTDGTGFDLVFDTTGHRSGVEMAAAQVRKGGQIVVIGLPGEPSELFMTDLVRAEVDVTTSYASLWPDFERAL